MNQEEEAERFASAVRAEVKKMSTWEMVRTLFWFLCKLAQHERAKERSKSEIDSAIRKARMDPQ